MALRVPTIDMLPTPELREQARAKLHPWRLPHSGSPAAALISRPNKYGAKAVYIDGHRFDSKLEAKRYEQLKAMMASGEYFDPLGRLVSFSLWPVFLLPGGVKAKLDSVQVWQKGELVTVVWEDAKGKDNQASKNKRKQIEALYGIKVQLWPGK